MQQMTNEDPKPKIGRPLADVDPKEVELLASYGCTIREIAIHVGCSEATLSLRFQAQMDKGREDLKKSLRKVQIRAAFNGNVAMMIWLGKQLLGQMDRAQLDVTKVPDDVFIEEVQRRLKDVTPKPEGNE